MADRVAKNRNSRKSSTVALSTDRRNVLLEVILASSVVMRNSCSVCEKAGIECVGPSPDSSRTSRCKECIRLNRPRCDAQALSPAQLRRIATTHSRFESELEKAEEERRVMDAKVERLRKQKKLWFEKMMRAVSRGIDSVEELERVEQEEAERESARQAEASVSGNPEARSSTEGLVTPAFLEDWEECMGTGPPEPIFMEDFTLATRRHVEASGWIDRSDESGFGSSSGV
jgi:hypothetical protein